MSWFSRTLILLSLYAAPTLVVTSSVILVFQRFLDNISKSEVNLALESVFIRILITFNNLKFFEWEISYYNLNTPGTNSKSIFLIKKLVFNGFLKIIGVQNQLLITFCSDLVRNNSLKARNSTHTHTNF